MNNACTFTLQQAAIRELNGGMVEENDAAVMNTVAPTAASAVRATGGIASTKPRASERWANSGEMLKDLKLEQCAAHRPQPLASPPAAAAATAALATAAATAAAAEYL